MGRHDSDPVAEKVRGPSLLLPPSEFDSLDFDSPPFRVKEPWDLLRGKDVFVSPFELDDDGSDLAHWAPNCATFSRAREIPIKNVKNPPKPIRSIAHPRGIPEEVRVMTKKQKRRLDWNRPGQEKVFPWSTRLVLLLGR